jgi:hypothetical protein
VAGTLSRPGANHAAMPSAISARPSLPINITQTFTTAISATSCIPGRSASMLDDSGWLSPVLLLPKNNILDQDMPALFKACSELVTAQVLMGGKYAMVRDQ